MIHTGNVEYSVKQDFNKTGTIKKVITIGGTKMSFLLEIFN